MSKERPTHTGKLVQVGDVVYTVYYDQLEVLIARVDCPMHLSEKAFVTTVTEIHEVRDHDDRPLLTNIDRAMLISELCRVIGDGTPKCLLCLGESERE